MPPKTPDPSTSLTLSTHALLTPSTPSVFSLLSIMTLLISLLTALSTAAIAKLERIPLRTALYATLTTISTTGFGDVLPPPSARYEVHNVLSLNS